MELSKISATEKRDFLTKLQSGKFILKSGQKKQGSKMFERLGNGLYHCKESGEDLSRDELKVLSLDYDFCLAIVSTRAQVAHEEPADGYQFFSINYGDDKALKNLLIPKE